MWLDGPISHLLLTQCCSCAVALLAVSPLHCLAVLLMWLGVVLHAKLLSHQRGPPCPAGTFAPVGAFCPAGYFAPVGACCLSGYFAAVRCRSSMGSVIARVKVALRAQLDRQGKH
jgi:hypothetical protein